VLKRQTKNQKLTISSCLLKYDHGRESLPANQYILFVNCIIYCRVSTLEQAEGTSLEFQEEACRGYARAHHFNILSVFVEKGESAKFADRTQLLELVDFCRTHKGSVDVLLVWKIDRFARNVSDHFSVKATLLKYGVRIVSVTEPSDQNPEGRLMETILAGFAQFDNDIRALRTVQGMRRKIEEGIFPWKPPIGYRSASQLGEKKTEPDVPDEPLFGALREAWREFATGAYTKTEILRLLGRLGLTTRRGKTLTPQSLDCIFDNPFYAGILVDPWSGAEHQGQHVPMITRQEFARVQQIIRGRKHRIPHVKEREEFPLRGSVRCPSCQRVLTAGLSGGRSRKYPYYFCVNRACGCHTTYPAEAIHKEFETFVDTVAPNPERFAELEKQIIEEFERQQQVTKVKMSRQQAQLKRLKLQLEELIHMRAETLINTEEFLEQKTMIAEQRAALEIDAAPDQRMLGEAREGIEEIKAPFIALRETWRTVPPELRPRFKQLVLPLGFIVGRIRTARKGLLFSSFSGSDEGESDGVALPVWSLNQILQEIRAFSDLFRSMKMLKSLPHTPVLSSTERVTPPDSFEPEDLAA
jgi:DNA invertase Pin-like site-specific DNA recombinase